MINAKISKSTILGILIYHLAIVNIYTQFIPGYKSIRICLAAIIALCLFVNIKVLAGDAYRLFNIILLLFFFVIIYSTFQGRKYNNGYWPDTVLFAITILELFLCFEIFHYRKKTDGIIALFFRLTLVYCILTDIIMIFNPVYILREWGEKYYYYFVGDKFDVAYLHMVLIALFCARYNLKRRANKFKLVLLFSLLVFTSIFTECTTGIFGAIIMLANLALSNWFYRVTKNPWTTVMYTVFCSLFLLFNSAVLSLPAVANFLTNVLQESVTLTGRTNIYMKIGFVLQSPWLGFGYDNNHALSQFYTGAADVQNGLLDCIVSYGIIGVILMMTLVVLAVKKGHGKSSQAFMSLLYVLITLSMVEITFRRLFFVVIAMVAFLWDDYFYEDTLNYSSNSARKTFDMGHGVI